ncbi:MAG: T9SS type A sorting domain-containing protein [Bacteroidota bacterium]
MLFLILSLYPVEHASSQSKSFSKYIRPGLGTQGTTLTWNRQAQQGFNLKLWMNNSLTLGRMAFDGATPPVTCNNTGIGLEYPAGSCIEHLYGGGPMIGVIVNGQRIVRQMYIDGGASQVNPDRKDSLRNQFWFSSIYDTLPDPHRPGYYKRAMNRAGYDDDGDGKIDEDPLDGIDNDGDWNPLTDDIGADGIPDSLEVGCKGRYDPVTNPDPAFDNYDPAKFDSCHPNPDGSYPRKNNKDKYTEKNGIPDHGEPNVDEDGAAYSPGDIYAFATDTFHFPLNPNPLGLQVNQKSYSWEAGSSADGVVFIEYTFTNIGHYLWQDVYLGWFGDPDVGPVYDGSYYSRNYSAYDQDTRTAYANNPIDSGSTPFGVTLIGASYPLDVLNNVFQWYVTNSGPGTDDSSLYSWMRGDNLGGKLIAPDQSIQGLADTRFNVSSGPFYTVYPGENIQIVYALVSGKNVDDMLNNARRAQEIYKFNYFIMPTAQVIDSGGSHDIEVIPHSPPRSPWGKVVSYRVYYGTSSGHYTDTVNSIGAVNLENISGAKTYYIRVRAYDEYGNPSALSDEMSNIPGPPTGIACVDGEVSIQIHWNSNTELDVQGYNIYRRLSPQLAYVKMNTSLLIQPVFTDTAVWGNKTYYYSVTAVDYDSHESKLSDNAIGNLLAPAQPANFIPGPGRNFIRFIWDANKEGDLRGYNLYRRLNGDTIVTKLNAAVMRGLTYVDSSVVPGQAYYYYLEAVDTTDAVSNRAIVIAHTVTLDQGVLVINVGDLSLVDSMKTFYGSLLNGSKNTIYSTLYYAQQTLENTMDFAGKYSAIFWLEDKYPRGQFLTQSYPSGLKGYLLGGGHLLIMGRQIPEKYPSLWSPFLSDIFGIDSLTKTDSLKTFAGATGARGFPSLSLDQIKLSGTGGMLDSVDRLSGVAADNIIYAYHTNPIDPALEGKPVGVSTKDTSYPAYYMSFPLYDLDLASAQALISNVLANFGIVTGVGKTYTEIPTEYCLYQAYPNPFNPTTTIRFDLPAASNISLKIYDVLGREVGNLADGRKQAGRYEVQWNASSYASGVYFYRLQTDKYIEIKKLLLMK